MKLEKWWNTLMDTFQLLLFAYVVLYLLYKFTETNQFMWLVFASFVCFIAFDRTVFRFGESD